MVAEVLFYIMLWLVCSFVAGFIHAWWEERKFDKERRERKNAQTYKD